MSDAGDNPLFELLAPAPVLPSLRDQRMGQVGAKYTPHRGAHRPCDHCVQLIHENGVTGAPPPAAASTKRAGVLGKEDVLWLCNTHAQDMREKDEEAKAEHDSRVAHLEHNKKAARSRA